MENEKYTLKANNISGMRRQAIKNGQSRMSSSQTLPGTSIITSATSLDNTF